MAKDNKEQKKLEQVIEKKQVRKLAIMLRIRLDGEDLNNEGNIGNVIQPRQFELCDGTVRNAISGEMLKHLHTRNLRLLADDDELCDTCKIFSPMRNGKVNEPDKGLSASGNKVRQCIIDDTEGFMNAGAGANEKRTSCIGFSWAIGTTDSGYQTMLHNRIDCTEKNSTRRVDKKEKVTNPEATTESAANTNAGQNTQMIFYRPLRSDEYAITIVVELDRIGYDDEKLLYTISPDERATRQRKCLLALRNMLIDIEGASCSTTLPQIRDMKGIIVEKQDKYEVLAKYSAMNDDFIDVNQSISSRSYVFNNMVEFCKIIVGL